MLNSHGPFGRRIALILIGALLCVLVALFGVTETGLVDIPFLNRSVSFFTTPIQRGVTQLYNNIRSASEKKTSISELSDELSQMKEENNSLNARIAELNELEKENERLRSLLNVKQMNPEISYIAAEICAKEPGGWFVTFMVDKGERDGVKKNAAVLGEAGLIGRVMDVGEKTSTVISIIDSRSSVAGMIERTRDNGVCHGSLYVNDNDELLQMSYLPSGTEINTGDRVITSGLDGIYPKGLFIGTVRSISREGAVDSDQRYVVLSTAVDFAHVESVLIRNPEEER